MNCCSVPLLSSNLCLHFSAVSLSFLMYGAPSDRSEKTGALSRSPAGLTTHCVACQTFQVKTPVKVNEGTSVMWTLVNSSSLKCL